MHVIMHELKVLHSKKKKHLLERSWKKWAKHCQAKPKDRAEKF